MLDRRTALKTISFIPISGTVSSNAFSYSSKKSAYIINCIGKKCDEYKKFECVATDPTKNEDEVFNAILLCEYENVDLCKISITKSNQPYSRKIQFQYIRNNNVWMKYSCCFNESSSNFESFFYTKSLFNGYSTKEIINNMAKEEKKDFKTNSLIEVIGTGINFNIQKSFTLKKTIIDKYENDIFDESHKFNKIFIQCLKLDSYSKSFFFIHNRSCQRQHWLLNLKTNLWCRVSINPYKFNSKKINEYMYLDHQSQWANSLCLYESKMTTRDIINSSY